MLIHIPWSETFRTPQGGFIERHHDLLFDNLRGMYVGEIIEGIPYVGTFRVVRTFVPEIGATVPFTYFQPTNPITIPHVLTTLPYRPFPFAAGPAPIPVVPVVPFRTPQPLSRPPLPPPPPPPPPPPSPRPNNTHYEVPNIHNDPFLKDYIFHLISKIYSEISKEKSAAFFIKGGSAVELYRTRPEVLISDIDTVLLIDPTLGNEEFYKLKLELSSKIIKIIKAHLRTYKDEVLAAYRRNSLEYTPETPSFQFKETLLGNEARLEELLKPEKNSIEKNMTNTTTQVPFIVTYNSSLDGQYFSFVSIKTKTTDPIPLLEIAIPYKGYPEHEFFWKTQRHDLLEVRRGIKIPVQSPVQLLFNQRYAAAKSRKNNNRRKRTERANFMRNTVVNPSIGKYKNNLQKIDKYFGNKNILPSEYPKEYSYYNLVQNIKPGIEKFYQNKQNSV